MRCAQYVPQVEREEKNMAKKLETSCPMPRRGLPYEFKYDYAMSGGAGNLKSFLYTIRETYGATAVLEIFDMVCTMDDRIKNLTNAIQTIFNLDGNDCEIIGEVLDLWDEFIGTESTILERSKTVSRRKVTKCPWKTEPIDIKDWVLPFFDIIGKTINSKASLERPKAMCAGDPYCEYTWKLEESTQLTGEEVPMAKKLETPCEAPKSGLSWAIKYDFVMRTYADFLRGFLYAIREKYGAEEVPKIKDRVDKLDDRVKRFTNTILKIFKIEGNDCETIGQWFDIWGELCGQEGTIIERSKTVERRTWAKCPWKTEPIDIKEWCVTLPNHVGKTINPKAILERPKGMCAGDSYCEYVWKLEE